MNERTEKMVEMYKSGMTLQEIGDFYSVSRQRVEQLLKPLGINKMSGGASVKSKARHAELESKRKERLDRRSYESYGCSHEERKRISGPKRYEGFAEQYMNQRNSSISRGVPWKITLPEWIEAWNNSGLIDLRGRGADCYVLTRKDFTIGFTKDNVLVEQLSKLVTRTRNFYKNSEG